MKITLLFSCFSLITIKRQTTKIVRNNRLVKIEITGYSTEENSQTDNNEIAKIVQVKKGLCPKEPMFFANYYKYENFIIYFAIFMSYFFFD